jgi:hypothetical protein
MEGKSGLLQRDLPVLAQSGGPVDWELRLERVSSGLNRDCAAVVRERSSIGREL